MVAACISRHDIRASNEPPGATRGMVPLCDMVQMGFAGVNTAFEQGENGG